MIGTTENAEERSGTAIELAGVQISYADAPDVAVLQDVKWQIGFGEFWVVGGQPSSGKSSLLLSAAGLNRPVAGKLRIFGREMTATHEKDTLSWRRRIGFVFEHSGQMFSRLTVAQNIALPLQYHGGMSDDEIAARVDALLTMTELQEYAPFVPGRLSLGVQQRVGLARALALPVELLFLDNPLSTLSMREARWWLDFLGKLYESRRAESKPLAIVASADDFRGWIDVADHFAIVRDGRFDVIGGREQVAAATEPAVREFLATGI
jgi:ABC-type transporter Mla maintaining outer membrane lipid asymmetry ATPase subunit MlaF